jgi:molybdenum cofactor synthesis domain-containing protein
MINLGILTASDKGSSGERDDESGKVIMDFASKINSQIIDYKIVPDDRTIISSHLVNMADVLGADLILTTGGTGFSPRDLTPEATLDVIDRQVPGIPEAIRQRSLEITPRAMLSRATAGIRNMTLIINLPGSPKAVKECLEVILPILPHAIEILKGQTGECASKPE